MATNFYVVQTPIGEWFLLTGYDIVQDAMARVAGSARPPSPRVVVVDITGFPTELAMTRHGPESALNRSEMSSLLDILTDPTRRGTSNVSSLPIAIGIDNDFSPDPESKADSGAVTPSDTAFFQTCQSLTAKTQVPIFLGIDRSIDLKPWNWLVWNDAPAKTDYHDMASAISVPTSDQQRLILWMQSGANPPCPSLSGRLSTVVLGSEPSKRVRFPFEQFRTESLDENAEHEPSQVNATNKMCTYLVDYSQVNSLIRSRIEYKSLMTGDAKAEQELASLAGCIVILGKADPSNITSDSFTITYGKRVPGVYLHACGVYSLLARDPLHELTHAGRPLVDLLLSAMVFGSITIFSLLLLRKNKHLATERVQKPLSYGVAMITVVGGVVLAPIRHLVWDDFLLVGAALFLHPHMHFVATNIHKTPALFQRGTWEKALFEHDEETGEHHINLPGGSS